MRLILFSILLIINLLLTKEAEITSIEHKGQIVEDYQQTLQYQDFKLAEAILKQYAPNCKVYILANQPLSYFLSGLANQVSDHTYLIQISRNTQNVKSTLFHELGHIIDAENGMLGFRPFMWNGKICDFSGEWADRPWEISAEQWQSCIWYEYQNEQLEFYDYRVERFLKSLNYNPFEIEKRH